ncbi:WHG domain-containing protein [Allobranchiibius sp. GilTou73]|nr:WHG domain-containing protein [Allobranchiibius sp. GilTou73]
MQLWSRAHGIISLEIEGAYAQMGLDAERLYRCEIDDAIGRLRQHDERHEPGRGAREGRRVDATGAGTRLI